MGANRNYHPDEVDTSAGPHTHPEADVTGLVADLAGKAAVVHSHAEADVTGLVADLAAKVPTTRTVGTTAPLTGGGVLSGDLTLAVNTFGDAQAGVVPLSGGGTANFLRADGSWAAPGGVTPRRVVGVTFDGNGSPPTAGSVGYAVVPFNGTIDQWHIVSDASGSAVVDVWKAAGAIPTDANRIAGTEKPTLAAAQIGSDTALSTWTTTAVTAGDVFGFELESAATLTRVTVEVRISESA